jgi:hypothetical protein
MVMSVRTSSAVFFSVISPEAHSVDWEVLEPSSSALQTDALPSKLPVLVKALGLRR